MRDLNHHKPAYHALAKIILLDCMCKKNDCSYPLSGDGLKKDFFHLDQSIPSAWLTAHRVLKKLDLLLIETDQSYITEGDASLSHIVHSCSHNNLQIPVNVNGIILCSLQVKGVRRLADAGNWMIDIHSNISAHLIQPVFDRSWSTAACLNWWKLFDTLHGQARIDHVLCGPPDLAIPQQVRKRQAENVILSLANVCGFAPSQLADVSTGRRSCFPPLPDACSSSSLSCSSSSRFLFNAGFNAARSFNNSGRKHFCFLPEHSLHATPAGVQPRGIPRATASFHLLIHAGSTQQRDFRPAHPPH